MKNSVSYKISLASVALALSLAPVARANNLVVDGEFTQDLGNFPGQDGDAWTLSGNTSFNGSDEDGPDFALENAWDNGAVGAPDAFLSQLLPTIAGDEYTISFELYANGVIGDTTIGDTDDDTILWDGVSVFDFNTVVAGVDQNGNPIDTTTYSTGYYADGVLNGPIAFNTWTTIVIDPQAIDPIGDNFEDLLSLGIRNDPGFDQITNVQVLGPSAAVPDAASSALLLGVGLLLSLVGLRRQVKAVR